MNQIKLLFLSVGCGLLLSLPWMTGSFSWLLFIAFIPLFLVEDRIIQNKNIREGSLFLYTLISFLVWNILSTWWISYISFAGMIMIVSINAFLMVCVWWLKYGISRQFGSLTGYFSLIVFWLTFEYLHFHWAIQWPWLTLGNGFANNVEWIQWVEYTGVLGGSLWILVVNIILFSTYQYWRQKHTTSAFKLGLVVALIVLVPMAWSFYRYQTYEPGSKTVQVAVIQPNIDPYKDKFSGMSALDQTTKLIKLAESIITDSTVYVLAPETSLETFWEDDSLRKKESLWPLVTFLDHHPHIKLIAGAITQKKLNNDEFASYTSRKSDNGDLYDLYNSALLIDKSCLPQMAHKNILVSGVEKIPFQQYFSLLGNLTVDAGGTSGSLTAGNGPNVFKNADNEGIGAIICFESAFGQYVGSTVKEGAEILFIITNDGWWKESAGLAQHFSFARLRAIETRRSIARSANTGISGFINERGDVIKMTAKNTDTAINSTLTVNQKLTFYAKTGDYLGWISLILALFIGGYRLWSMGKKTSRD